MIVLNKNSAIIQLFCLARFKTVPIVNLIAATHLVLSSTFAASGTFPNSASYVLHVTIISRVFTSACVPDAVAGVP